MNIAAGKALNGAKERLGAAVGTLRRRLDADVLVAFDDAQAKWQAYCEAWANFEAGDPATGGTIWPVAYAGAAQSTIERRIEELGLFKKLHESR
jgi:hypothetical protein